MVSRTAIESYFENKNNFSSLIDTPYFDILERLRVENMCLLSETSNCLKNIWIVRENINLENKFS